MNVRSRWYWIGQSIQGYVRLQLSSFIIKT
nr:MAG TPA: hypothetical protein [Herelleviridae sp.]